MKLSRDPPKKEMPKHMTCNVMSITCKGVIATLGLVA
jgi:hypothetical protein